MGSKKIVFECHDLRYQNVILPNKERVSYKRPESSSPFIVNIENLTFHNKFLTEDKDVEIGRAMSASEFMKNEAINEPTSE